MAGGYRCDQAPSSTIFLLWLFCAVDFLDQRIRDELAARLEREPGALDFVPRRAGYACLVPLAVAVAFVSGFAVAAWLLH